MNPPDTTTAIARVGASLRFAVIIPSVQPPAWIVSAVDELSREAKLVSWHLGKATPVSGSGLYGLFDQRLVTKPHADAPSESGGWGEHSPDLWPPDQSVDVIFCLGVELGSQLSGHSPRYGVWSVALPPDLGRSASIGGQTTQTLWLQEVGGDRTLRTSTVRTHRLSPAITRQRLLWRAARLPARGLRDLAGGDDGGGHDGSGDIAGGHLSHGDLTSVDLVPSTAAAIHHSAAGPFATLPMRALRTAARRARHRNGWYLGFQIDPPTSPDLPERVRIIQPPADRFWADPFPVVVSDELAHIYVEEWPHRLGRGRITVLEIRRDGSWQVLGTALETEVHLSHPYIVEWKGERFLIPETSSRGTIEVYRQKHTDDPLHWEQEAVMMDGVRAVDATIQKLDDRWWMFANLADAHTSVHDELHIFHSQSPLGPWTPHRANPVVSDPRRARPGGQLFHWEGRLCRPAQDCGARYGRALTICEVEELTPTRFRERPLLRLEPESFGADRLHTLNTHRWLRVIDLHRDQRRW